MFCHITQNWRGRPLVSHEVVVNLTESTTKASVLVIRAELDRNRYPSAMEVSDEELSRVRIDRARSHGGRNNSVLPRPG